MSTPKSISSPVKGINQIMIGGLCEGYVFSARGVANTVSGTSVFIKQIRYQVQGAIEKSFNNIPGKKKSKLQEIHSRFIHPDYLNSNQALFDLEYLIFSAYKDLIFGRKIDETEIVNSKRRLAKLAIFLRKLSNSSGVISKRSSGQTAFSHWIEAVYIYLQTDPNPTIDGIMRIGSHDSIEDSDFNASKSIQWTRERTLQRLEKFLGKDNLQKVKNYHTKPRIERIPLSSHDQLTSNAHTNFPDQYKRIEEEMYLRRKLARNNQHLYKIRHELSDLYFLEKMADALSNMRNLDAFSIDGNTQNGIEKIRRKCMEVIEYYLPRVKDLNDGYYCQMYSELKSLDSKYHLALPLESGLEGIFAKAMQRLSKNEILLLK